MAEQKKASKLRAVFRGVLKALLSLLAMGAVYVGAVLLQIPGQDEMDSYVVVEPPQPVSRMQTAAMTDPRGLAQLFGAPLPMLPGYAVSGQGANAVHDGENARVAALRYEGLTITAVQPVTAAPLLLRDELSVSLRGDVTVLSQPAVLARKDDAFCVYFSNASAAYSVYAAHAGEEEFFEILDRLSWAQ